MQQPLLGVVEGYYGEPWSVPERMAQFPVWENMGLQGYLYAPKADRGLRSRWDQPWSVAAYETLQRTLARARQHLGQVGVGFSPLGAAREGRLPKGAEWQQKLMQLRALPIDTMALLFDDMPVYGHRLAEHQIALLEALQAELSQIRHWYFCPTFYSDDPILPKLFGAAPSGYLDALARILPQAVAPFWTGPKVISPTIRADYLNQVARRLGRPVALWDNYPVNDGAKASNFLYLSALRERDWDWRGSCHSHWCNPMRQPYLSQLALGSLAWRYRQRDRYDPEQISALLRDICLPERTARTLAVDGALFEQRGLVGMDEAQRLQLLARWREIPGDHAREVRGWLMGQYRFDPACLTDS